MYSFDGIPELDATMRIQLPHPGEADEQGIIGFGGNLSPGVLLSAYEQGFFPWYNPGEPILWWSPDPRFVIHLDSIHISRRDLRTLKKTRWTLRADQSFEDVIRSCSSVPRGNQEGTWLSNEMIRAYVNLHHHGYAHSVEVYDHENKLVGGLYGVSRGGMFCGESMFSLESGASKLALLGLGSLLEGQSVGMIDSQVANPYIAALGGSLISRDQYLESLAKALEMKDIRRWDNLSAGAHELVNEYVAKRQNTSAKQAEQ